MSSNNTPIRQTNCAVDMEISKKGERSDSPATPTSTILHPI
jgi:hypothetical protein